MMKNLLHLYTEHDEFLCTLKCQISGGGVLINRNRKKFRNLINGGFKINGGGSEFEQRLYMIIQGRKEQKEVVIKHKTKIYTKARYFAIKIGCKWYQQRKEMK